MKNVKIVFVDLDGTLKDNKGLVSINNKKTFQKLRDIGIEIVISTGRPLSYAVNYARQYLASPYTISSNGAEIYNYITKKVIYKASLTKETILKLEDLINKNNLSFIANSLLHSYTNILEGEVGKKQVESFSELIDEEITQVIIQSFDPLTMELVKKQLASIPEVRIANKVLGDRLFGKRMFFDITANNVSKGNAVRILCEYLNIPFDKTMAVGDADNDIEMLKSVNIKVAMENASENLKKVANVITASNEDEGVSKILEELYKELMR